LPIDPADLVVSVPTLRKLDVDRGLARTLQQVVDTAEKLLDADGVGLMLTDSNGQLRWVSASNQWVQDIEEHQDRAGLGLCAAALSSSRSTRNISRNARGGLPSSCSLSALRRN